MPTHLGLAELTAKHFGAIDMIDRIFEIFKRAWYLFFGFFTVIGLVSLSIQYIQYNRIKEELVIFALALPFAYVLHKTAYWIIWGKVK
jgi:hypothetical protein